MTDLNSNQRLRRDEQGSLPIILALMMVPLAGIVGGAVDFGHAIAERTRLNTALDAAAIVAAKAAQDADAAGKTDAEIKSSAEKAGTDYFNAVKNLPPGSVPTITVALKDRSANVTAGYTSAMQTTMMGILGYKTLPIAGSSNSTVSLSPMVDIHLLIDVSASMAIGATAADVATLQTRFGCAFACHDGAAVTDTIVTGTGKYKKTTYKNYADSFDWAQQNGVTLRINEINKGIKDFVSWLELQTVTNKRIRIAVSTFSNDLTNLVPLTKTLSDARNALPNTPSASSTTDGGTHFSDVMPTFAKNVGAGGDGTATPKKLVIIATDGVQDPNRLWSHSGYEWMRPQVRPFAPADCRKLDSKVSIGVLYAPYINLSPDWGYLATLGQPSQVGGKGTRFDDIVPQLKACATAENLFIDLSTKTSVGDAFKEIFKLFTMVRLSK